MKIVGEAMSIGRTFKESMQKACARLETGAGGFGFDRNGLTPRRPRTDSSASFRVPTPNASSSSARLRAGWTLEEIHDATAIDPWFLDNLSRSRIEGDSRSPTPICDKPRSSVSPTARSPSQRGTSEDEVRAERKAAGIIPTYRLVDTCAAEFEAYTPYFYSTYGDENEARQSDKKKIMILGGGPNRIGQGIEFDYCCVHAAFALKELGYETIMVNSNPETVSTDYDTSDKLFFEPLTLEDVLNICDQEQPWGVIVQFGGQTPLNLAADLERHGVPIIGTSPKNIELAEDRKFFSALLDKLELKQARSRHRHQRDEAIVVAEPHWLPGAGPPLLRARRPRHDDRLQTTELTTTCVTR